MKTPARILMLVLLAAGVCAGQAFDGRAPGPIETAFTFDWLRTNAPPGQCGCFRLTGMSESLAVSLTGHWAIAGEIGDVWQSSVQGSGLGLNFGRYLAGGRYTWHRNRRISWFAQALIGVAHQGGSGYPPAYAFAFQPGGGLDIALGHGVLFRPIELDYLRTAFPNAAANRQNSIRYGVGLVFRFRLP